MKKSSPPFPFDRDIDPAQLRVNVQFLIQASAPFIWAGGITGYAVGTSGLLLYGLGSGGGKIGGGEEAVLRTTSGEAAQHASSRRTKLAGVERPDLPGLLDGNRVPFNGRGYLLEQLGSLLLDINFDTRLSRAFPYGRPHHAG